MDTPALADKQSQFCVDTGYNLENLPRAMDNRNAAKKIWEKFKKFISNVSGQ